MAIIIELTSWDFVEMFRAQRPDDFSDAALHELFDFYDHLSDCDEEDIKFDPIAMACDWTEFETLDELNSAFGTEYENITEAVEALQTETVAIHVEDERVLIGY